MHPNERILVSTLFLKQIARKLSLKIPSHPKRVVKIHFRKLHESKPIIDKLSSPKLKNVITIDEVAISQ